MADNLTGEALRGRKPKRTLGGWILVVIALLLAIAAYHYQNIWDYMTRGTPPVVATPVLRPTSVASGPVTGAAAPAPQVIRFYQVKAGETLNKRFGPSVGAVVCQLNKELGIIKHCDHIKAGQWLRVPRMVRGGEVSSEYPDLPMMNRIVKGTPAATPSPSPVKAKAKSEVKTALPSKANPVVTKAKAKAPKAKSLPTEAGIYYWKKVGGAPLAGCGKKSEEVINEEAWVKLGLTEEEKSELREKITSKTFENTQFIPGMRLEAVAFCKEGKVSFRQNVVTAWDKDLAVWAKTFVLQSGRKLHWVRNCGNWVLVPPVPPAKPPVVITVPGPQPEQPMTPPELPVAKTPDTPPTPLSAFPKVNEIAEWEVIVGAGVWDNNLAHGKWHYGEGMLSAVLPDGYRAGVGAFGMWGSGASETSSYKWKEKGVGPQIGLKRNFLKEQVDQFGQTTLMPAGWGLKARFLKDSVSGGNSESGYSMSQAGRKVGLYAEYLERKSPDWMVGGSAELWHSYSRQITSTWSGDKPQDRGSASLSAWAQYRHNDDWQTRGVVTLAHQNWDQLNLLRGSAELRYKETVMCGPSVALALNKPAAYAEVHKSDLTTRGFSCRLELGGIIRTATHEADEAAVERVGQVPDISALQDAAPPAPAD